MSLTFDDVIKTHLSLLMTAAPQVLVDFCRLALDFITNGPNNKRYKIAAQKLDTPVQDIENAVTGLVNLLIDGCKYSLSDEDFQETVALVGFAEEHQDILLKFFVAKRAEVKKTLSRFSVDTPAFWDLEWRLEAQVASRSMPEQVKPTIVMDLMLHNEAIPTFEQLNIETDDPEKHDNIIITEDNGEENRQESNNDENLQHVLLQCDIPNLVYLTGVLETALRESKSYHVTKTQNAFKK